MCCLEKRYEKERLCQTGLISPCKCWEQAVCPGSLMQISPPATINTKSLIRGKQHKIKVDGHLTRLEKEAAQTLVRLRTFNKSLGSTPGTPPPTQSPYPAPLKPEKSCNCKAISMFCSRRR